jgi:non-ribosomal peptide synthetase component F
VTQSIGTNVGPAPLSVAQEALWYLSLLFPNQISYNEAFSIRRDGPFDLDAFRRSFNEIVRRHEAWRTTFDTEKGVPIQVLRPPPHFDLPVIDLSHLGFDEAERRAVGIAAEVSKAPYDLRRGPLLRPRLIRFSAEHHRLYLAIHHLAFDAVSVYRVVLPELVALYDAFSTGAPSPLPKPPPRYADYARWEQHWITQPRVERRIEHWRKRLTPTPELRFPFDHRRPETPRFRGGVVPLSVPAETVSRLRQIGQGTGATLFQVIATAWSMLLGRYSGQDDVVFATAADLRQRPEFEGVVGCSNTSLVLRIDLGGDPGFSELVVRVRNELLDGLDNLVPFERLVREIHPETLPNANPIYQTLFILEPPVVAPDPTWSIHLMERAIGSAVGTTKMDLVLELDERPDGHIAGRLFYDRDLFERSSAVQIVEHWLRMLDGVAADPTAPVSRISLVTEHERQEFIEWNSTATIRTPATVDDLITRQSARSLDATALVVDGQVVSHAELVRRAGQVAHRLSAAGVKAGEVVALLSRPTADLVAAMLGVLQAGAVHLLLDPAEGTDGLDAVVADSGATALLAEQSLCGRLSASSAQVLVLEQPEAVPRPTASSKDRDPGSLCALQYTERDGAPVGVALCHGAVVNLCAAMAAELGIGPADVVVVLPSTLYRSPAMALWMPLMAGARIVVAPEEAAHNGALLSRLITEERVSFAHATPGEWRGLIDTGLRASRGLALLSGGGALGEELADQLLDRCRVLWNAYGTFETTTYATLGRVERGEPVTVGRPIANTRVHVVDAHGHQVPVGMAGELLVAGAGVASGYRNRDDLSANVFVDDRFGAGTAFRTGQLARWRAGGSLELVTRPGTGGR